MSFRTTPVPSLFCQVDPSATASFLGYVVAAYSLGQLVASPFFGVWSNHRPVREPLVVSTIINVAANIVYAYANAFPAGKKWALLVSRAFVGFGAGEGIHRMPQGVLWSWVTCVLSLQTADLCDCLLCNGHAHRLNMWCVYTCISCTPGFPCKNVSTYTSVYCIHQMPRNMYICIVHGWSKVRSVCTARAHLDGCSLPNCRSMIH